MKLRPITAANALCLTTVFLYVLCWVLAVGVHGLPLGLPRLVSLAELQPLDEARGPE
jgi:hypothetical protein